MSALEKPPNTLPQDSPPYSPSLPWRIGSAAVMGIAGGISRVFLYGLNRTETPGLDRFLKVLEERRDVQGRTRGLLTVSNHISVLDDPLMWGVLPFHIQFTPDLHRWTLASYDLCFTNKALSTFFSFGQTLPTHRAAYSEFGGLFQPTVTQAIRLLSAQPYHEERDHHPFDRPHFSAKLRSPDLVDPFSSNQLSYPLTYTTTGQDTFPAPSAYLSRRHSWVHIFPEGRIHQHPSLSMRYFRWGVSRLILESEPLPQIVPIFVDGTQRIMHESRKFPRFVPRVGRDVRVCFGGDVDGERVFGDLRRKWKRLVELQKDALRRKGLDDRLEMGELTEGLKYHPEVVELRLEVTKRMRGEILRLRRELGYPEEDPKNGMVETWEVEGGTGKREGVMADGSWVKEE